MVKRDSYMNRLIHSMWNGEIKVITGIRRCGKSVLLFDLFFEYLLSQNVSEDHILKIELDQRRYYKFRNPITLCEYVESTVRDRKDEKFYLFIDEVQFTTKVVDKENGGIEVTIYDMLNELKAYKTLMFMSPAVTPKGCRKISQQSFAVVLHRSMCSLCHLRSFILPWAATSEKRWIPICSMAVCLDF